MGSERWGDARGVKHAAGPPPSPWNEVAVAVRAEGMEGWLSAPSACHSSAQHPGVGPPYPAGLSPITSPLSARLSWVADHRPPREQRLQPWVATATRGSPCPGCCCQLGDSKDAPMPPLSQASTAPCRPLRCFAGPKAGCGNPSWRGCHPGGMLLHPSTTGASLTLLLPIGLGFFPQLWGRGHLGFIITLGKGLEGS